jgi:hypothetical protein
LRQFQDQLTRLKTEPLNLPIISIRKDSCSCISDVHTKLPGKSIYVVSVDDRIAMNIIEETKILVLMFDVIESTLFNAFLKVLSG